MQRPGSVCAPVGTLQGLPRSGRKEASWGRSVEARLGSIYGAMESGLCPIGNEGAQTDLRREKCQSEVGILERSFPLW